MSLPIVPDFQPLPFGEYWVTMDMIIFAGLLAFATLGVMFLIHLSTQHWNRKEKKK